MFTIWVSAQSYVGRSANKLQISGGFSQGTVWFPRPTIILAAVVKVNILGGGIKYWSNK